MTGEEFIFLSKHASGQTETQPRPVTDRKKKYVHGIILGIAKLFGVLPTTNCIKKSGKIDKAYYANRAQDYRLMRKLAFLNWQERKLEDGNNGWYGYGLYERDYDISAEESRNPLASLTFEPARKVARKHPKSSKSMVLSLGTLGNFSASIGKKPKVKIFQCIGSRSRYIEEWHCVAVVCGRAFRREAESFMLIRSKAFIIA